jgi:hypothetical protein
MQDEGVIEPVHKKPRHYVCYLNLHLWLTKDTRTLIWKKLTEEDKFIVKKAHNIPCDPTLNFDLMITRRGHLNLLKWWREYNTVEVITTFVIVECVFLGHVHILDWIYSVKQGLILVYRQGIADMAVNYGQLDILKFFWNKRIPLNTFELSRTLRIQTRYYPEIEHWLLSKTETLDH